MNFEALIIAMSVVGGMILIMLVVCCCCCCKKKSKKQVLERAVPNSLKESLRCSCGLLEVGQCGLMGSFLLQARQGG